MKKIYPLFVIILFCICIKAQPASDGAVAKKTSSELVEVTKDEPAKKRKAEIPAEKARPQSVPKIALAMTIDGRPDEDAWKTATVFKDFYQTYPGDNIAPSKPTEVLMMYDEKHLYLAFKCWDEKDKIRATVAKRDNVFGEDNVRVWLDTYNDQRRAYVLGFNPLGIQQDGIYTEGQGADFSVDIVMESKGVIEDWGWSVEVKIPFKSLRYSAGKGKFWGFNAARNIDRFNDEFDQWMPDDRNVSGFLIKSGKITGLDEIKYERTLEIVPSVTLSQTGRRTRTIPRFILNNPATNPGGSLIDPGRFVNEGIKQDIGVTVKYTISPNVTLDAAINPDFAEIEADAPVITANQRFPIFFQEKRPFFLEGADIFQTPLSIYDSRSIIDPDFATKLTGKIGKNSFGFMLASDKAPGNFDEDDRNDPSIFPRVGEFLDKSALFGVLRVKRDFGKENHIGFFATYRDFPERKNILASIDSRIKLNPRLTSQIQLVGTHSKRCFFDAAFEPLTDTPQAQRNREICGTGTYNVFGTQALDDLNAARNYNRFGTYNRYRSGNAVGYYANLDYTEDTRGWFAEVGGRTRDFTADVGFTRRTDTNFAFFASRFSTKSNPKAALIRFNLRPFTGIDYDWSGRLQKWRGGLNANFSLQRNMFAFVEGLVSYEKLYEEEFGLKRMPTRIGRFSGDPTRATWQQFVYAEINQSPNKRFTYFLSSYYSNNSFDFFFPAGNGQINPGSGKQFGAEAFVEWKPIDPLRASVSYEKSRLVRNDNRVRSFDSDIVSVRSTYQFTRFIYTRLRIDYDGTRRNTAGQLLFGWNPSPGKALYIGYNDNFNYNSFNPFTGQREPGFERNSRTFFVRASYSFRKSF